MLVPISPDHGIYQQNWQYAQIQSACIEAMVLLSWALFADTVTQRPQCHGTSNAFRGGGQVYRNICSLWARCSKWMQGSPLSRAQLGLKNRTIAL